MPIFKIIKLPSGKKIRSSRGKSNRGGRVLYWKIHKVPTHHKTYQSALKQLQAIKSSQRRRRLGIKRRR